MSLSQFNSALTVESIRLDREHQYLERKGRDTKPGRIADELIGMLNAGGGTLVYGVADDGAIEDLKQGSGFLRDCPKDLNLYRTLVADFILPPARIELEEVILPDGELIFLYHVDQDYERLFQRKDSEKVFLRVADSNRSLNREEVKALEYNKTIRSFEEELRADFDEDDLDGPACAAYAEKLRFRGSFEELALKRHLAIRKGNAVVYKNAAILLFAQAPEHYIPNASVRYVRYTGSDQRSGSEFNVVKDERFEGNIPELIRQVSTFLEASMRDYYFLDLREGLFRKVPEIPREAWLEGVVNALCHRSYNLQGNPVLIRHYDDRLEIANSGPLPAQVTVENIERERYARNPRVARVLTDLGFVRELNEGVPRIFTAMRGFLLARPEYRDEGNTVTLTLRNRVTERKETILKQVIDKIESNWNDFNGSQQRLVNLMLDHNELTIRQMIDALGITDQSVRYNLKKLEGLGIFERVSEKQRDPNAIYRFRHG